MTQFDNPEVAKNLIRGFKSTGQSPTKPHKDSCPKCDEKMIYPEPRVIHLDPPRKKVRCTACDYSFFEDCEAPEPGIDVYQNIMDRQSKHLEKHCPKSD